MPALPHPGDHPRLGRGGGRPPPASHGDDARPRPPLQCGRGNAGDPPGLAQGDLILGHQLEKVPPAVLRPAPRAAILVVAPLRPPPPYMRATGLALPRRPAGIRSAPSACGAGAPRGPSRLAPVTARRARGGPLRPFSMPMWLRLRRPRRNVNPN